MQCAANGATDLTRALLQRGAPLTDAMLFVSVELPGLVRSLLANGADVHVRTNQTIAPGDLTALEFGWWLYRATSDGGLESRALAGLGVRTDRLRYTLHELRG